MILMAVLISGCVDKEPVPSSALPGGERRARADSLRAAGVPPGGLTVHFTVVDDTGARVPGAQVNLVDPTRTDPRCGSSVLAYGPKYQTKQLMADDKGELTATLDFTPLEVSASAEDFSGGSVIAYSGEPMTLQLNRMPLVHWRGRITARDGTPLEHVHVYEGDTPWPEAGVAGTFDIKLRTDRPMPRLRFRKMGFSPREVVAQETDTLVLDPRPTITISLVNKAGALVKREVYIEAQRDGQTVSYCTTNQDTPASCTLDGEPGPLTLLFGHDASLGSQKIELRESTQLRWTVEQ
ncbi:hypothetical protein DAT35_23815 [Vitiosangium sp. GDMCC 1.1324]|nr:hypothetical protein DAT35_23815 [Vitiosangium sp. GDMCC 1.1324]